MIHNFFFLNTGRANSVSSKKKYGEKVFVNIITSIHFHSYYCCYYYPTAAVCIKCQ